MTIRSYSSLIILETLFDSIPTVNPDLNTFVDSIFSPFIQVTESDCGTALGELTSVNYDLEGKVELSTGQVISRDRVEQLLTQGIYKVPVRNLSTCIAREGICQACYKASRQYETIPALGNSVKVEPEFITGVDVIGVKPGDSSFTVTQPPELYDRLYVYYEGILLSKSSYTINNTTLVVSNPLPREGQLTVRYTTLVRAPFLAWLADTYAGSLLGLKALPYPKLPIRKRLLTSVVPEGMLDLLAQQLTDLKQVPEEATMYLPNIKDPLEKALFVIALFGIYLNVN